MKHPDCGKHYTAECGECEECLDLSIELEYAERYAVASIIYYGGTGIDTGMTDAQFDGFCDWLLKRQIWKRIPWIERELLLAGSGYDTSKFPERLHDRVRAQIEASLL